MSWSQILTGTTIIEMIFTGSNMRDYWNKNPRTWQIRWHQKSAKFVKLQLICKREWTKMNSAMFNRIARELDTGFNTISQDIRRTANKLAIVMETPYCKRIMRIAGIILVLFVIILLFR